MAKYKTCEKCGAALDHGEICDCGREEKQGVAYKANQAAIHEALEAEVVITLEKKRGSETFRRKIEASSAPAALNGLAVLLREYAKLVGLNEIEVLALLATVMTVPGMEKEKEAAGRV
ncbi:MAG: hypothetical protein MRZ73_12505 [Pseudoflavonifractor capillosus]|uniref:hypothetical protein n=1 Tax=Pseudoflavonifractor capillosus TaxID=106588 RepID=UPI0023F97039|nr:hypothetical protein [Pseudoflavonifractor capillosus]MCI5929332.1 hypothetical protein [Pseudoflavonifractor capillosus]MDY4661246.1 hypothetical protein [Pseudoflavonifractor capillosus]